MTDSVQFTEDERAAAEASAAAFESMLERLNLLLEEAHDNQAASLTIAVVDLASLFLSHEKLLEHLTVAAQKIVAVDAQAQALVNLNTALVLRYGGEVRITPEELAATHGAKLTSAHDESTLEQIVTITRTDPETGEEVKPSRIIVPGRLPLARF
jgi:hypothetical protein